MTPSTQPGRPSPPPTTPPDGLADLFWAITRRLRHHSGRATGPSGVTPSQFRALRVLQHLGTTRPGVLARHLGIAPRSATEVIDVLEEQGLVERRKDPSDRRAVLVALTPEGDTVLARVRASRLVESERFFSRLGPEDRAELTRILTALID